MIQSILYPVLRCRGHSGLRGDATSINITTIDTKFLIITSVKQQAVGKLTPQMSRLFCTSVISLMFAVKNHRGRKKHSDFLVGPYL